MSKRVTKKETIAALEEKYEALYYSDEVYKAPGNAGYEVRRLGLFRKYVDQGTPFQVAPEATHSSKKEQLISGKPLSVDDTRTLEQYQRMGAS